MLLEGQRGAAGVVEVGAPGRNAAQVVCGRCRAGVEAVHLGAQRLELSEGDVAGAALGRRGLAVGRRLEGRRALLVELGDVDDVGRGVQITLTVAAHQLEILGEGDVALEHAGAHASARQVGLSRVLGELQRTATTMGDGEGRRLDLHLFARVQHALERAVLHAVDQEVRTRAQLNLLDGLEALSGIGIRLGRDLADGSEADGDDGGREVHLDSSKRERDVRLELLLPDRNHQETASPTTTDGGLRQHFIFSPRSDCQCIPRTGRRSALAPTGGYGDIAAIDDALEPSQGPKEDPIWQAEEFFLTDQPHACHGGMRGLGALPGQPGGESRLGAGMEPEGSCVPEAYGVWLLSVISS